MKRALAVLILCGTAISVGAQTMYDALNFSRNDYLGTARSVAMGNAFTALGGDLGSITINPAGSAVASYSQFTITPALSISVNNATGMPFNGEANGFERNMRSNQTKFAMPNIGFGINFDTNRSRGLKSITVGVVANVTNTYQDNLFAKGSNRNSSFMGSLAAQTNGWHFNDLAMEDAYYDSSAPWNSILGWQAGLISVLPDIDDEYVGTSESFSKNNDGIYDIRLSGPLDQVYGRSMKGSKYDYVVNLGMNFSDVIYVGANLGITSMEYVFNDYIREIAQDPSLFLLEFAGEEGQPNEQTYFKEMKFRNRYEATGVGVYGKFGIIARPFAGLRLGAAIQTPTSMMIKEYWQSEAASFYTDSKFNASGETPEGQYKYKLVSPFRFNIGAAYTFGKAAVLSADYEMCNYGAMRFKAIDTYDNSEFDDGVNGDIKTFMGASHMLRIGAEIKPVPSLALRAGYGLTTSPEQYYDENDIRKAVKANTHSVSAGIGYSTEGSFFADLALKASKYPNEYVTPYGDYLSDMPSPEILNRKWIFNVLLTLGFRF